MPGKFRIKKPEDMAEKLLPGVTALMKWEKGKK
jgi:hypothetical protein